MTVNSLTQTMHECDNGQLKFNLWISRSFLFGKKWYPLRATVIRAADLSGDPPITATERALVELVALGIWKRVDDVAFQNNRSVEVSKNDLFEETKRLSRVFFSLTN